MSDVGVYDFKVPHEFVRPTRDMVIIRMPLPPKKVGNILVTEVFRQMAAYNVAAGRIVAMGPLAFTYKDADGLQRQDVKLGDWVAIRPFAGTMSIGGKVEMGNWRYVSSFQDVIGIIPADKMPDPATLLWEDETTETAPKPAKPEPVQENVRERITLK